jgi:hypothetical protein
MDLAGETARSWFVLHADAPLAIVVALPAGAARRTVWMRRPAGVVRASEVTLARGTTVLVTAAIPGVAQVDVSSTRDAFDRCRDVGTSTICSRAQEACPMPASRWRVTFTKRSGPAGSVLLTFRIGPAQHRDR